jgi:hypothetical protein
MTFSHWGTNVNHLFPLSTFSNKFTFPVETENINREFIWFFYRFCESLKPILMKPSLSQLIHEKEFGFHLCSEGVGREIERGNVHLNQKFSLCVTVVDYDSRYRWW